MVEGLSPTVGTFFFDFYWFLLIVKLSDTTVHLDTQKSVFLRSKISQDQHDKSKISFIWNMCIHMLVLIGLRGNSKF